MTPSREYPGQAIDPFAFIDDEVSPDNVILQQRGPMLGTGHHSVVQVPGTDRWYIWRIDG